MNKKVLIITGASSGIGAATAKRIASQYHGLVLQARKSGEALEQIADIVREHGTQVITRLGNLTDSSFGNDLVQTAVDKFGRLDGVVANAGFPIIKSFSEGTDEDLEYAFKGNVHSFFSLARAAAPLLKLAEAPRIVAVGSFTSHVFRTRIRQFPMSAASKGALEIAVKGVAMELASKGITVNCVVPGFVQKDHGEDSVSNEELKAMVQFIPLGRPGCSEDIAAAIEFLLSPQAGYITGQTLHVNGGLHI